MKISIVPTNKTKRINYYIIKDVVEIQQIGKSFKTDFWSKKTIALNNISFKINEGKITGLLGLNGAGKTTLIKIMMKFITPSNGQVVFDSRLGHDFEQIKSKIGFLPERPSLYPYLKGSEFIRYMGLLVNMDEKTMRFRSDKLADKLKISHALHRKIRGYSKGMLQRLGLVSTLMHNPEVLILDEPLSGLDPVGRKELKDILYSLGKEGKTVFFSGHIINDVEELCDQIVVLQKGELLYEGSIDRLMDRHATPYFFVSTDKELDFSESTLIKKEKIKFIYRVPLSIKETFIQKILDTGGKIKSVEQDKPRLEEIIFKIKK